MAFATVTPSLVIFGAPKDCSITTLRPLGPSVTCTAEQPAVAPQQHHRRGTAGLRGAHLHGVGELVDALQHQGARIDAKAHVLAGHAANGRAKHGDAGASSKR